MTKMRFKQKILDYLASELLKINFAWEMIQFIPVDCKLTTEASKELISQNKFKYDDLKSESPESLQFRNRK